jgi:hypothetical protein
MVKNGLRERNTKQTEEGVGSREWGVGIWILRFEESDQVVFSSLKNLKFQIPTPHSLLPLFLLELESCGELPGAWAAESKSLTCLRSRAAEGFIQSSVEIG